MADTTDTVEATSTLPAAHLLQANAFAATAAPVSIDATPTWLNQAPVFNPAQMLVQSTKPTYFGALTAGDRSAVVGNTVAIGKSGQTPDTAGAENVTDLRKALITMAMNLRDIRYVRGGRDPSTGFDCSGFVRYVFAHAIGLQLPTNSASQFLAGLKVNRADMKPGDLVFFRTHGKRNISHVGIYISEGRFIHSPATGKSVEISSLNDAYWAKRFAGAKRPEAIVQVAHNG
ncbi:C40 family peptidase [Rhodanobacter koreensis]